MPISDKKKCQTLINLVAQAVEDLQAAATLLKTARTAYTTQSVDPTGTPLEGNIAAISTWIDEVDTVANSVVANGFLANAVETHKNKALGDL